jgi:hypothetical protein
MPALSASRGIQIVAGQVDGAPMIWPVAALAGLFLCFVVVYGTRLQARIEASRHTNT